MTGRILLAAGLIACQAHGQAFELASIKAVESISAAGVNVSPAGTLAIDGSLAYILKWAFDLRNYLLSAPQWTDSARFHIAAKAPGPAAAKDLKLMLRTLLADRFKLAYHWESKEFPVYALVVAKDGPKLKESSGDGESVTKNNKRLGSGGTSRNTSMTQFAELLNGSCPDPVVDLTGLKGRYDFSLDIAGYLAGIQPGDLPGVLSDALRKQLGLDLVPRKVSMEVLVVDHAERNPAEN